MMTMADPTRSGLSITPDPLAGLASDVFDFVERQWLARRHNGVTADPDAVAKQTGVREFVSLARELFSTNQPVALDMTSPSLALRFQDGSVLPFCNVPDPLTAGGEPGSMPVSTVHPPSLDGKGKMANTPSWGVTSGNVGGK